MEPKRAGLLRWQELSRFDKPSLVSAEQGLPALEVDLQQFDQRAIGVFADGDIGQLAVPRLRLGDEIDALCFESRHVAAQILRNQADPHEAKVRVPQGLALLQIGESLPDPRWDPIDLAAYTNVAQTLMNFDDAVMRN